MRLLMLLSQCLAPAAFAALVLATACLAQAEGTLTIVVSGAKNDSGVIRVALFNSPDSYSSDRNTGEGAFKKAAVAIKDGGVKVSFDRIPPGDYAVKAFHDEDNSGRFVTGAFGIPKVEYGFSNNARGLTGPPGFDKARFHLEGQDREIAVRLR